MIDSCQGLDDIRVQRNYVSANVRRGKATSMDQPKPNTQRADQPLQVVHFIHANNPRLLDVVTVSFSLTTVLGRSRNTWVYSDSTQSKGNPNFLMYSRSSIRRTHYAAFIDSAAR